MAETREEYRFGEETRRLQALREQFVARGVYSATPIFAASARGARVRDVEGHEFLDFAGGIGTLNAGHNHPDMVAAVHAQVERLIHTCFSVLMYEPYVQLCRKLVELMPGGHPKKAILVNSGAEAVENAVKIARAYTRRPAVIAFSHAFHGRTLLTLSLTGREHPYKDRFRPLAPEIYHAPYPYPYRGRPYATAEACLDALREALATQVAPEDTAAVIVEPVLGEGGFVVPPAGFLPGLEAVCREHGILLIVDEIQSGFMRTGRMFAFEHFGITPDLVAVAKSLAGGLPLSGVIGRREVMDAPVVGSLGGTYGGNPVACAAALAVIEVYEDPAFQERVRELGRRVWERLLAWRERFPAIGDIRGLGLMLALELVKDRETKEPAPELTQSIVDWCWRHGLVILKTGTYGNCIRFLMPLVITDEELNEGLSILEAALEEHAGAGA